MAGGWELVPGLHAEEPSETVGFPPLSDQTNPQQGLHNHLFWDTGLGWKTGILHGRVINIFGIILYHKLSLDIEASASQGWDLFALKSSPRSFSSSCSMSIPCPFSCTIYKKHKILTVLCHMMVWLWFSLRRDPSHCYQGVDETSHQPNICRNINTANRKNRGN